LNQSLQHLEDKIIKNMSHQVSTKWTGKMSFESEVNGHKLIMDAEEQFGGNDLGPRPKPLLLAALAGCTGMDIVSVLTKMRAEFSDFNMDVTGDLSENQPKIYTNIHLVYRIKITDKSKMERAVQISQETLCGVSDMLKKAANITWEINYL
jgi:putative redox protein